MKTLLEESRLLLTPLPPLRTLLVLLRLDSTVLPMPLKLMALVLLMPMPVLKKLLPLQELPLTSISLSVTLLWSEA